MDLQTYKKDSFQEITLPSGLAASMRAPSILELVQYPKISTGAETDQEKGERTAEILKLSFYHLIRIDGGKVVSKEPDECEDDELSIFLIQREDANFVLSQFASFFPKQDPEGIEEGKDRTD